MTDHAGQQLGNYRLIRKLGQGTFAEVYLGKHRYLNSEAALKILRISLGEEAQKRFLFEAQMLVRLKHPHIIRVLEFFMEEDTPVLVMEHAAGDMLRQAPANKTHFSLAQTLTYVQQAADALQYAHNNHLIHRDVKPGNMLLDAAGNLLLSDFGLALLISSSDLFDTQGWVGTPAYIAPEQLQGKPCYASDQYALGVITYEWLCGKRPFEGGQWEIFNQHLQVDPPPMRQLRPDLPAAVEEVVRKALAKNPLQRFVSVQAFALAFERAIRESHVPGEMEASQPAVPLAGGLSLSESTAPRVTRRPVERLVFLAAAPADEKFAVRLKTDLSKRDIHCTNSISGAPTAQNAEAAMHRAIRTALVVLTIISPQMRGSRAVKEQLRIASMYQRRIVLVWVAGEGLAQELLDMWSRAGPVDVIDARQGRYFAALDEIADCLEEVTTPSAPISSYAQQEMPGEPRNPYRGLRPFTGADTFDFFGRDTLITQLTATVHNMLRDERPDRFATRMLTVVGPSGSGKSSVVMAGLLPRLQQGGLAGSDRWLYLDPIVPGMRPIEALASSLYTHMPDRTLRSIREDLEDDSARALHLFGTYLTRRSGVRVVLLIDQFEEVFTRPLPEQERRRFLDLLVTAATEPRGPFIILLTLRADFYDRPMHYPEISRLIQARHISVLPMDIRELRSVIEKPAAQLDVQLSFDDDLVGDLLFETVGQAGALPLLEFTLDQLFQRRNGHRLTEEAYKQIGGVQGALANHAEATYRALPTDEHRSFARVLFLRLINPGANEQDTTRRRASLFELTMSGPRHTAIICEVADAFIAARLLTTNVIAEEPTVEVSHETLIREWQRLVTWLHEARSDLILHRTIGADVSDWLRRGRSTDRVYQGPKLVEARMWAERSMPNADEVAFIRASILEEQQRELAKEQQQFIKLKLQRRVINRQRLLVGILSIFLLVVTVLAGTIEKGREQIDIERQQAISLALTNRGLANNQIAKTLLFSTRTNQINDTYDTREMLQTALERNPHLVTIFRMSGPVEYEAFRTDKRMFVSLSATGAMTTWNIQTRKGHTLYLDVPATVFIQNWALSPDGRLVAGASDQGLWLWDASTGVRKAQLETAAPGFTSIQHDRTPIIFSPDGILLASGRCKQYQELQCTQGRIQLWNMAAQKPSSQTLPLPSTLATQLAFTPDGNTLIASTKALDTTGASGGIQFWNLTTRVERPFVGFTGDIMDFTLSRDGKTLAASDSNGAVYWWEVASQKALRPPLKVKGIHALAISSDNRLLATDNSDNAIEIWNVKSPSSGEVPLTLAGHEISAENLITNLMFSSDSKMLVSGDNKGEILLWNMTNQSPLKQQFSYASKVTDAIFSPDGTTMLIGDMTGKITLRDIGTNKVLTTLDASAGPVTGSNDPLDEPLAIKSLMFGPDKHTLAVGRSDGQISLWNMTEKRMIKSFRQEKQLFTLVFNGQMLAADYDNGTLLLWDATSGRAQHRLVHPFIRSLPTPNTLALSPDGKMLASCNNTTVDLWNISTGESLGQLSGQQGPVTGVAFSADGSKLASIDSSNTILLWDVQAKSILGEALKNVDPDIAEMQGLQNGLSFSPDGTLLAAAGDQSVTVWELNTYERFTHALHTVSSGLPMDVVGVTFHSDGKRLLIITDTYAVEHDVTVWNLNTQSWREAACGIANRNLEQDEWDSLVGNNTSYRKVCSNLPLNKSVIDAKLVQAHFDVVGGKEQDARAIYAEVIPEAAQLDNADAANDICWAGSTHQFADLVLPSCEEAVALYPYSGAIRDSRGLARALMGNRQGAIEDFTFFVQWIQHLPKPLSQDDAEKLAQRQNWIKQLKAGQNPFGSDTLKKLQRTDQLGK